MAKLNLRNALTPKRIVEGEKEITKYVRESLTEALQPPIPYIIGKKYIIRTVTMVNVGQITDIIGNFIVMRDAVWVSDTGRWSECLAKADGFQEVEPFKNDIHININSIIDSSIYDFQMPKKTSTRG